MERHLAKDAVLAFVWYTLLWDLFAELLFINRPYNGSVIFVVVVVADKDDDDDAIYVLLFTRWWYRL